MQTKISDKITLNLTEQGFTYCNWIHINGDVKAILEAGFDSDGLMGLRPDSIDLIVNSHHHIDHIRGDFLIPHAEIMIHELETHILTVPGESFKANSLDLWGKLMPTCPLEDANSEIGLVSSRLKGDINYNRTVHPLHEGQIIDFGNVKVEVLHTPGHSAGHCCFFFPNEELLFSSDICMTKAGPWYGEAGADPGELIKSIDRIIELNPPRMVSSHTHKIIEKPVPSLEEFKGRIFKRDERIYKYLKENPSDIHTLADAKLIYLYQPTAYVVFWEKLMLLKHLTRLSQQGLVEENSGIYYGK